MNIIETNSSYAVFSVNVNIRYIISKCNETKNIYSFVSRKMYEKTNPYLVKECKRIYNEIENCYYTYDDMVIYYLHVFLITGKLPQLKEINQKNVKEMLRLYTDTQAEKDMEFIKTVSRKADIKGIYPFTLAAVQLVKEKYISPRFLIDFLKRNILTKQNENDIFNSTEELKKFLFALKKQQSIFIGGFKNAEKEVRD